MRRVLDWRVRGVQGVSASRLDLYSCAAVGVQAGEALRELRAVVLTVLVSFAHGKHGQTCMCTIVLRCQDHRLSSGDPMRDQGHLHTSLAVA